MPGPHRRASRDAGGDDVARGALNRSTDYKRLSRRELGSEAGVKPSQSVAQNWRWSGAVTSGHMRTGLNATREHERGCELPGGISQPRSRSVNGRRGTRTPEGVRQQIYSLPSLPLEYPPNLIVARTAELARWHSHRDGDCITTLPPANPQVSLKFHQRPQPAPRSPIANAVINHPCPHTAPAPAKAASNSHSPFASSTSR